MHINLGNYPAIQTYIACHPAMLYEKMTRNYVPMLHVIWYYRSIQTRISFLVDKWISNDIGATYVSIDGFHLKKLIGELHTWKKEKPKRSRMSFRMSNKDQVNYIPSLKCPNKQTNKHENFGFATSIGDSLWYLINKRHVTWSCHSDVGWPRRHLERDVASRLDESKSRELIQ